MIGLNWLTDFGWTRDTFFIRKYTPENFRTEIHSFCIEFSLRVVDIF